MTNKEETLDWLYRVKREINVWMPKEWLIPMNNALDAAINTVKREEMLEDWTKKCRKFEADYENRLKADMVAILVELQLEIEEIVKEEELIDKKWANGLHYSEKVIQQKIDKLKESNNESY